MCVSDQMDYRAMGRLLEWFQLDKIQIDQDSGCCMGGMEETQIWAERPCDWYERI